jgi:LuxR family transcriptional regulator, quorum-sensing system regulator BjaR1
LRSNVIFLSQVHGRRDLGQAIICGWHLRRGLLSEDVVQRRAFRHSLDHTLAFIRDLDRARNLEDVSAQVMRYVAPFGIEHMVATTIPGPHARREQQLGHLLLNRWPEEWANRYASRGYVAHDATIHRLKSSPEPFLWSELAPYVRDDLSARRVMDEAIEFNLKEGFTLSLQTLDRQTLLFSLGGRHLEINPDTRGVLTLVANYAVSRAIMLNSEPKANAAVVLSPREREALQWASEGKGDWEIGEVMNISEHGADKHMRSVRTKLGAINRTQAVAEALRRGLIA